MCRLFVKIEIITRQIEDPGLLREFMHRKIQIAVDRSGTSVERATIRLEKYSFDPALWDGICTIYATVDNDRDIRTEASGFSALECVLQAVRQFESILRNTSETGHSPGPPQGAEFPGTISTPPARYDSDSII